MILEWAKQLIKRVLALDVGAGISAEKVDSSEKNYSLTRWLFLHMLGLVYLAAFVSLWVQIQGLAGSNGILPVHDFMEALRNSEGAGRYWDYPTLCWFADSDGFLNFLCAAGVACSLALIFRLAPAIILLLLWILYLSLSIACQVFLEFQWDSLLLETGFLAIFFAPWKLLPRLGHEPPPAPLALWLLRWLLFRLMFSSGLVKVLADDAWRDLFALNYHFETQPLPTWIGWWMHQLPHGLHAAMTLIMFIIELVVPFLIFSPRRPRFVAFILLLTLQILILLSGNYAFFNWLTIALCILLLDDRHLRRFFPRRLREKLETAEPMRHPYTQSVALGLFSIPILFISGILMLGLCTDFRSVPEPLLRALQVSMPLRSINSYGLFARMTRSRPEIIIEGSNDGKTWQAYEFKWKPGDLRRRPGFVAPHQPRLDWQMWFAALGDYSNNPWLIHCMRRLLQGSPQVLGLLQHNPFPEHPPAMIRAELYDYHFTTPRELREKGEWWRRERLGAYTPAITLEMFKDRQSQRGRN